MKILVIGDSCTDVYIYGKCNRLAPEGPVPVFMATKTETNGGMARNVYENLLSLNEDCDLITNIENITKTRYVEERRNHLLIRIDSHERKVKRIVGIEKIDFSKYDAIVISDYDHGYLTEEDISFICQKSRGIVFMDTKKPIGNWCMGIDFIKINEFEYEKTKSNLDHTNSEILDKLIVTMSDRGCMFRGKQYPVSTVEVKDMTGAGDTFLSGFVHDYIRNKNIDSAIDTANKFATIIVQHKGVNRIGDFL